MDWKKAADQFKEKEIQAKKAYENPYWHTDKYGQRFLMADIITLLVFTIVGFCVGIVLLAVGIWHLSDSDMIIHSLRTLVAGKLTSTLATDLTYATPIVWGLFSCVPFSLLLGAIFAKKAKRAKWNMRALMGVLIVLLIFEIPTTIIPIALLSKDTSDVIQAGLQVSMNTEYEGLPSGWLNDKPISTTWDDYMIWQDCCGVDGSLDFLINFSKYAAKWMTTTNTYILQNGTLLPRSAIVLPTSCCKLINKVVRRTKDWWNIRNYLVDSTCPVDRTTTSVHNKGCFKSLYAALKVYTEGIFIGLFLLCLLQIVTLVVTNMTLFCPAVCQALGPHRDLEEIPTQPIKNTDINSRRILEYDGRTKYPPVQYRPPVESNRVRPQTPDEYEKPRIQGEPFDWKQSTYSNQMNDVYYSAPNPKGQRRF